jgi:quinol monooxygenase YgiN
MKRFFGFVLLGSAISMLAIQGAQAQGGAEAVAYCVSYIEVSPAAKDKAAALLKDLAKASRKSEGNLRFDVLRRRERTNHFAIVEAWKDKNAFEARLAAASTKEFREKLQPLLTSGYDERPHTGLVVGPMTAGAGARGAAVYVVTHVDVIPPKKDEAIAALQQLADPSRKDAGNLRYDVLQQISRPNHSTLVEIWKDQTSLEAHEGAAHTMRFRELLLPMSGSLYDQRLYRALD